MRVLSEIWIERAGAGPASYIQIESQVSQNHAYTSTAREAAGACLNGRRCKTMKRFNCFSCPYLFMVPRASTAGDGDATQQPDLRARHDLRWTHSLRVLHGGLCLQRVKSGKTSAITSLATGKSSLTQPHKLDTSLTAGKTSLKVSKVGLTTNLMKPICG